MTKGKLSNAPYCLFVNMIKTHIQNQQMSNYSQNLPRKILPLRFFSNITLAYCSSVTMSRLHSYVYWHLYFYSSCTCHEATKLLPSLAPEHNTHIWGGSYGTLSTQLLLLIVCIWNWCQFRTQFIFYTFWTSQSSPRNQPRFPHPPAHQKQSCCVCSFNFSLLSAFANQSKPKPKPN